MNTDVAIIGGGPGGSAAALRLRTHGINVTLIEREPFPRFHIGESMTGECGRQVRELGLEDEMAKHRFPVKLGTAVYGPKGRNRFYVPVMGRDEDRSLTQGSTWQVRRSAFDKLVQDRALSQGTAFVHGRAVRPLLDDSGAVTGVRVRHAGSEIEEDIGAKIVLDTSGSAKFLAHAGVTSPVEPGRYFRQVAIFSHVKGALRGDGEHPLDTILFYREPHHWAWFIPIDEDVTSVGVVVPSDYFQSCKQNPEDFYMREIIGLNDELTRRLSTVERIEDVRSVSNYSYEVKRFAGPGFMCVGDSHRFIDPIFSFGLFTALEEADLAVQAVVRNLEGGGEPESFDEYQTLCVRGLDRMQTLVDGFWSNPFGFAVLLHQRYLDDFIDMFAGRVYDEEESPGLKALTKLNNRTVSRGAPEALSADLSA